MDDLTAFKFFIHYDAQVYREMLMIQSYTHCRPVSFYYAAPPGPMRFGHDAYHYTGTLIITMDAAPEGPAEVIAVPHASCAHLPVPLCSRYIMR